MDLLDQVGQFGPGEAFLGGGCGDSAATAADTARRSVIGGRSGSPGVLASDRSATACGGGGDHPVADPGGLGHGDAQPEAGEHQGVVGLGDLVGPPLVGDRWKGLPVAVRTFPSVQAIRSAGVASALRSGSTAA